jgi:hypothetical protein
MAPIWQLEHNISWYLSGLEVKGLIVSAIMFLDKLIKNLVIDAIEWDRKGNMNTAPSQRFAQSCQMHI